jgi:hypothetical protein
LEEKGGIKAQIYQVLFKKLDFVVVIHIWHYIQSRIIVDRPIRIKRWTSVLYKE